MELFLWQCPPLTVKTERMEVYSLVFSNDKLHVLKLGMDNIKAVKTVVQQVLSSKQNLLHIAVGPYLYIVVRELQQAGVISEHLSDYHAIISSFLSELNQKNSLLEVSVHCANFLSALSNVGGAVAEIAKQIYEEWLQTVELELGIKLNIS